MDLVYIWYDYRCCKGQATGQLGRNSRPRGLKVALGSQEGDKYFALHFLQLLKKLVLVQNELFVGVGNHFVIIAQFTISSDSKLGRLILKFSVISCDVPSGP